MNNDKYCKLKSPQSNFYFLKGNEYHQQDRATVVLEILDWCGDSDLFVGSRKIYLDNKKLIELSLSTFLSIEDSNKNEFEENLMNELIRTIRANKNKEVFNIYFKNDESRSWILRGLRDLVNYYER
jgi:hypothetical protein